MATWKKGLCGWMPISQSNVPMDDGEPRRNKEPELLRALERALEYEIKRQSQLLAEGRK